jgi:fermentation-respiration switch protein FrsA (DUF1100 family)
MYTGMNLSTAAGAAGRIATVIGPVGGSPLYQSGDAVSVFVRAWPTADGATWAAARNNLTAYGQSIIGQFTLGGGTLPLPTVFGAGNTPPYVQLAGFSIVQVPEPGSLALVGMGLASLLVFRRRN